MAEFEVIRGAENEIEFQGLRGKYVFGLLIGLACCLIFGLILFVILPSSTLAGIITIAAAASVTYISFTCNKKYGRWGLERETVRKKLPHYVIMKRPESLIRNKSNNGLGSMKDVVSINGLGRNKVQ
ncbi:DUF4133 domain-containing protein [Xanthocytophaga flava]|uniref:DUF4133 domain-containing protein n=1 Tax=Xanthocytophaga flava TaxID=3048013 RepID=UPI0028D6E7DC|nr:DUF4133 domain-containing protein [Xanthocytophaga flavus]MDJ1470228.1 DUF4133 domain-containing protein [Xanthocytophaga flavus]